MTKYFSILAGAIVFLAGCHVEPRLIGVYGLLFLILLGLEDLAALMRRAFGPCDDCDDDEGRHA
jgi:hypothetical protein